MKKSKLGVAAAVLAALIAVRLLLPDGAGEIRRAALEALGDRDYKAALETLGNRLSVSGETGARSEPSAPAAIQTVAARMEYVSYHVEEASTLGERAPEPALPEAVTVFLESQAAFSDYALPENVDYGYQTLPFDYALPVSGYNSSGFGYRVHPIQDRVKFHYGTDIAAFAGEDIVAFADGIVTFAGPSDSYGNYIIIDHGGGWTTLYAHCSYLYAKTGQSVSAGEKIALVGATGLVTGPHLHFELQRDGIYVNPEYYINSVAG